MNTYDRGDVLTLEIDEIKDASGTVVDPSSLTLRIRAPRTAVAVRNYPGTIVKAATGHYKSDVTLDKEGLWHYRWETTGTPQIAEEGALVVRRGAFGP